MTTRRSKLSTQTDSSFILKVILFALLGTLWIRFNGHTVLPAGLCLGLLYARNDKFMIDRKIEYALLIIAALIGLGGAGLYIGINF